MPNDTPDDPIYGRQPANAKLRVVSNRPFVLQPARLPDPTAIPPRPWLYGTHLLRGFVSVLVAPGATGKSLLAMTVGVSIATGRPLLHQHVFEQTNAAYVNLEDPMDELERRLAALQIEHAVSREALAGRFFLNSGDDRELTIATIAEDGSDIIHPDKEALIHELTEHKIGALIVDPFAESHDLEENSNPQMIRASKAWRAVARATDCAILLVHHVRKGIATDIDAARGAKALTDSARIGLLMAPMNDRDATELGIDEDETFQYVRLDNAKANMSPRASRAAWFQLRQVALGNSSPIHPHGDQVAAIVAWQPPSVFGDLTTIQCNEALDQIAAGPRPGVRYAGSRRGKANDRWAGQVLIDLFGLGEKKAAAIIATWLRNGVLVDGKYHDDEQRRERMGLTVNDVKRPGGENPA